MQGLTDKYKYYQYHYCMVLCRKRALGWFVERDVLAGTIAGE